MYTRIKQRNKRKEKEIKTDDLMEMRPKILLWDRDRQSERDDGRSLAINVQKEYKQWEKSGLLHPRMNQ